MQSAAQGAPHGLVHDQPYPASAHNELTIDSTHPLAEAHEDFHRANGQLLTRNTLHALLGGVLLITSEVVRREAACGWQHHQPQRDTSDQLLPQTF